MVGSVCVCLKRLLCVGVFCKWCWVCGIGLLRKCVGLLQCVAVCCSVLHCVTVCCSVLQCVAVCCIVLQFVAVS